MLKTLLLTTTLLTIESESYIEKVHGPDTEEATYLGSVYFHYNASNISALGLRQAAEISERWVQVCNHCGDHIKVIGFADSSGKSKYNLKLGLIRAQETAEVLGKFGVNMENARVASYGSTKSLSRAAHFRRAEVWLMHSGFMGFADKNNLTIFTLVFTVALFLMVLLFVFLIIKPKRKQIRSGI